MKKFYTFTLILISAALFLAACGTNQASLDQNAPTDSAPTQDVVEPPEAEMADVTIYFMDENRFATGSEPYEAGVVRQFHADAFLPRLAVEAYFQGPTEEEKAQGLTAVLTGCTGIQDLTIEDKVAHVVLAGPCSSGGSTYTIAGPLMKTLRQFEEIDHIKLYDAQGNTEQPLGNTDSIPFVLEP